MDLWRWAPVPSDLPIPAGSSTSVKELSDRQQLAVTYHVRLMYRWITKRGAKKLKRRFSLDIDEKKY